MHLQNVTLTLHANLESAGAGSGAPQSNLSGAFQRLSLARDRIVSAMTSVQDHKNAQELQESSNTVVDRRALTTRRVECIETVVLGIAHGAV
jgi:hypothetical protein